jgi:hypothetical protein
MKKKRGRPPIPPHKRYVVLTVSVGPEQRAWIELERMRVGQNRSEFVRQIIVHAQRSMAKE